jgi:hypothetical protein
VGILFLLISEDEQKDQGEGKEIVLRQTSKSTTNTPMSFVE